MNDRYDPLSHLMNHTSRGLRGAVVVAVGVAFFAMPKAASAGHRRLTLAVGSTVDCETRAHRIWHEPVYGYRKVRVWLPEEVVTDKIPQYDYQGRLLGYQYVQRVVRPARLASRNERFVIEEGYYETVYDRICEPSVVRTVAYPHVALKAVRHHYGRRVRHLARYAFRRHRHHHHGHGHRYGVDLHRASDRGWGFSVSWDH